MVNDRRVFLVHGRNHQGRQAVQDFLASLDVLVMSWREARSLAARETDEQSPSILQIIRAGMSECKAIVILFTPDDFAHLRQDLWQDQDGLHERRATGQPRQNVLFEAGSAFALYPDRTVIVEIGRVRPASDLDGIYRIRLASNESRREFRQAIEDAGCVVNQGVEYLEAGQFVEPLDVRCQRWTDHDYSWKLLLSESDLEGLRGHQFGVDQRMIAVYVLVSAVQHGYSVSSWLRVNMDNRSAVYALVDTLTNSPHRRSRLRAARALEAFDSDVVANAFAELSQLDCDVSQSARSLVEAVQEKSVTTLVRDLGVTDWGLADWQVVELLNEFRDYPNRRTIRLLGRVQK